MFPMESLLSPRRSTRRLGCASIVLLASVLIAPSLARAEAEPPNQLIWAARACYVEATFRESDCVALLWVARKRAEHSGREWLDMLADYSAVHADNPRAREVRGYPWGDVAGKSAVWNRQWQHLREVVVEFASGQRPDPCPRARHWGGSMDSPRGRMVPARCSKATVNTFYAVRAFKPAQRAQ